jgi:hypothetical protein
MPATPAGWWQRCGDAGIEMNDAELEINRASSSGSDAIVCIAVGWLS